MYRGLGPINKYHALLDVRLGITRLLRFSVNCRRSRAIFLILKKQEKISHRFLPTRTKVFYWKYYFLSVEMGVLEQLMLKVLRINHV